MPERISLRRRIVFALGSMGYQLGDRLIVAVLIYFYLPPDDSGMPELVPAAWFGAAMMLGRVVDTLADPVVGHASDRSRSALGRRRSFLIGGLLPMVAFPLLAFFPPGAPGSALNTLWLVGMLMGYFVAFTAYVAPYLALVPEIAWDQDDRVRLMILLSIVGIPAAVFGFAWSAGLDWGRALGFSGSDSIRGIALAASAASLLLCTAPIVAVDERRFGRPVHAELPFGRALSETLKNRPYMIYLGAQLLFIFGVNLLAPILPYLAEVVLGRSPGFALYLGLAVMGATAVGYPAVLSIVRRAGPKRTMVISVALFALALMPMGLLRPDEPGGPFDAVNLAILFSALVAIGVPVASFYVVPSVIIGQLIDADAARTGSYRSAMFFGVQGLVTKWMYGVSAAALAWLFDRFGKSTDEPAGVLLAGPVAGAACLIASALYALYPEREVVEAANPAGSERPAAPSAV